jgi:hypothetical protein
MFVTIVALMCMTTGNVPFCREEIVTDSSISENITFFSCANGAQAPLAEWKANHPVYRNENWTIKRYICVPGHYVIKDAI